MNTKFCATITQNLLFCERFSEISFLNHWYTSTCSTGPSDCGAFTRHCPWVGSSPQASSLGLSMVKRLRRKALCRKVTDRPICILPLAHGSVRAWEGKHQSQPGRLRYFLNRMQFHPSKERFYKFSALSVFSVDKK